ncbi:MAG: 1-deoxy-D-xylulose-5-phosphate synthase [Eubacteriales bacterium]
MNILDQITDREQLLAKTPAELNLLKEEIRQFLVEHISQTGGHLASNLGVVELTLALHKVFDTSKDRLVFDVGHQAYVHKILTGRRDKFHTLRTYGGIAGFPKPSESVHDAFVAGHASNSVSVALGMARARTLKKEDYSVIALIGDGAMTGGLAYEGFNNAGASGEPLIVILNDNGMSISPNVGGISKHLKLIRTKPGYFGIKRSFRNFASQSEGHMAIYKISSRFKNFLKRHLVGITFFEEMGFSYIGPVDGTDIGRLTELLQHAKELKCPVLMHVITKKGSGYKPAEDNPHQYHGVGKFDAQAGISTQFKAPTFSNIFGETMAELAEERPEVVAISAAMLPGTGLDGFAKQFPTRTFDVGIAEGHAVTMAAGMAKQGLIPVVALYSTFLQRAYDMLHHDVGLLGLHVVFAVDRAGLVGEDGETHHGIYDVGYLRHIPHMEIYCPANGAELKSVLRHATLTLQCPVAIRYPKGSDGRFTEIAQNTRIREGTQITVVTYGTMVNAVLDAADLLEQEGISLEICKLNSIQPYDYGTIAQSFGKTKAIYMVEEVSQSCCLAHEIFSRLATDGLHGTMNSHSLGTTVTHGDNPSLLRENHMDGEGLVKKIKEVLHIET